MAVLTVDIYAGAGGWEEGARSLGITRVVGFDNWLDACRTASAAGHLRVCADVATYPTARLARNAGQSSVSGSRGMLGSPPCQAWSAGGKRLGEADRQRVHELVDRFAAFDPTAESAWMEAGWADPRSHHAAQPVRWIRDIRPEWVCLEQVPPVLALWQHVGRVLGAWGYSVWTGLLDAANYGTPQNRERAILIASRVRRVSQPPASHYDARLGEPLFGGKPWVTIGDALGLAGNDRPARAICGNRAPRWAYANNNSGWTLVNSQGNATERTTDEPAGTVFCSRPGNLRWQLKAWRGAGQTERYGERPGRAIDEPSFTIRGSSNASGPRLRWHGEDETGAEPGSPVAVSVTEAAVLQGFRSDYPWFGNKTSRFHQVGNAIPPQLAAACIGMATGSLARAIEEVEVSR